MIEKFYYEKVIDEIIEVMKTNILLYYGQDNTFELLKKYCSTKDDEEKYKPVEYFQLVTFTKETMAELISNKFLYDFRELE